MFPCQRYFIGNTSGNSRSSACVDRAASIHYGAITHTSLIHFIQTVMVAHLGLYIYGLIDPARIHTYMVKDCMQHSSETLEWERLNIMATIAMIVAILDFENKPMPFHYMKLLFTIPPISTTIFCRKWIQLATKHIFEVGKDIAANVKTPAAIILNFEELNSRFGLIRPIFINNCD